MSRKSIESSSRIETQKECSRREQREPRTYKRRNL